MSSKISREVAGITDHTLLRPEATRDDVAKLVATAREFEIYAVCVSPSMLPLGDVELADVKVATVCGFPSGAHHSGVKAAEAARAVADGADEVDMVMNLSLAKDGHWQQVGDDIVAVRDVVPRSERVLKVIIESAALTETEIATACEIAVTAGADFVKTSTGFHPAGGATVRAVEIMKHTVGDRAGIKASGGIRTADDALTMIAAGATRLGMSSSANVLSDLATRDD